MRRGQPRRFGLYADGVLPDRPPVTHKAQKQRAPLPHCSTSPPSALWITYSKSMLLGGRGPHGEDSGLADAEMVPVGQEAVLRRFPGGPGFRPARRSRCPAPLHFGEAESSPGRDYGPALRQNCDRRTFWQLQARFPGFFRNLSHDRSFRFCHHPQMARPAPGPHPAVFLPTPNGVKVSIALEELGLPYEPHLVSFETQRPDHARIPLAQPQQ